MARAQPGKLSYGVEGSPHRLIGQLILKRGGVDMQEIRYKANQQNVQDALAGRTQFMISSLATTEALVRAGKMRRIAVASSARFPGLEDLALMLVPVIGTEVNGARRWINLGMTFQPSSFLQTGYPVLLA